MIKPYHDLASVRGRQAQSFAEKLFQAGFWNVDEYDENGMTPLMTTCYYCTTSMARFLLHHGADLNMTHRDANLRAGHYFPFNAKIWRPSLYFWCKWEDSLGQEHEAALLKAAFAISGLVESRCRCSPDGFSPVTAMFRTCSYKAFHLKKKSFEVMMRHLNLQHSDKMKQWRCLVVIEMFDRLELTHTCIDHLPPVRIFPEDDRLEIEEEEEELYVELQSLIKDYDEWQKDFVGDIVACVNSFFDRLDLVLRPYQGIFGNSIWYGEDADILGPGMRYQDCWVSSRGKRILQGHSEEVRECNLLDSIFA
ncbi:hypothetical protein MMC17_003874 [Xylographa soralifera]|nr:hypothetical protein [Xylographa soralifera]